MPTNVEPTTCMWMWACVCVHVCACVHACVCACVCCVCACVHVCVCVCVACVHVCMCVCACMHMCVHIYVCEYICAYTCITKTEVQGLAGTASNPLMAHYDSLRFQQPSLRAKPGPLNHKVWLTLLLKEQKESITQTWQSQVRTEMLLKAFINFATDAKINCLGKHLVGIWLQAVLPALPKPFINYKAARQNPCTCKCAHKVLFSDFSQWQDFVLCSVG